MKERPCGDGCPGPAAVCRGVEHVPDDSLLPDILLTVPHGFDVTVRDGIVTMTGRLGSDHEGRAILEAVRHVQGVVAVRDRLSYPADGAAT